MIVRLICKNNYASSDSRNDWFNVGNYKRLPNEGGGQETCLPEQVHARMKDLLKAYNDKPKKMLEDIIDLHCQFERIHPFQDGKLLLTNEMFELVPAQRRYMEAVPYRGPRGTKWRSRPRKVRLWPEPKPSLC